MIISWFYIEWSLHVQKLTNFIDLFMLVIDIVSSLMLTFIEITLFFEETLCIQTVMTPFHGVSSREMHNIKSNYSNVLNTKHRSREYQPCLYILMNSYTATKFIPGLGMRFGGETWVGSHHCMLLLCMNIHIKYLYKIICYIKQVFIKYFNFYIFPYSSIWLTFDNREVFWDVLLFTNTFLIRQSYLWYA